MSGPFGSSQWMYASGAEEGQSLRFDDGDSAYLSWTPASAGNRKTWTWSGWVKRGNLSGFQNFFIAGTSGSSYTTLFFDSSDKLSFQQLDSSTQNFRATSVAVFRDPSAWYNIVFAYDSTQATNSNGLKLYVNGTQQTLSFAVYTQNNNTYINSTSSHGLGTNTVITSNNFDGYIANACFIDGQQLDPTSFGEYDDTLWKPKSDADIQSLTFGTNGFYLPFKQTTEAEGFSTVTYTGNGGTQSIEGVGFEPDFVWLKSRNAARSHGLFDSVRGVTKGLASESTSSEYTSSAGNDFVSFDSSGFTVGTPQNFGSTNTSGDSIVAWCWDAGSGSAVSNTDGSITSTVKANTTKGFSIATYTGNATDGATIGHGLSQSPDMVIVKDRTNSASWRVMHKDISYASNTLYLDATYGETADDRVKAVSSTTFTVTGGGGVNGSARNHVAYCFHSVSGYSSIGSYSGTGSAGNSITGLGFKPAWLMIKRTDSTGNWFILDNTRSVSDPRNLYITANTSNDEKDLQVTDSVDFVDFDSDGFTIQNSGSWDNASGGTYIYMAFADTRDATFFGDTSGNSNNWTPNALNNTDVVPDSPVTGGNFATFNANMRFNSGSLSEGNLKSSSVVGGSSNYGCAGSTITVTSGKWYCEMRMDAGTVADIYAGAFSPRNDSNIRFGKEIAAVYLNNIYSDGSAVQTGLSNPAVGDIFGFAVDVDNKTCDVTKNGSAYGSQVDWSSHTYADLGFQGIGHYHGSSSSNSTISVNYGQDSSFAGNETPQGNTDDNGVGDFYYAPPSGFLALTTGNLPAATITAPDEYFNTVLYTGNGTTQSITGVGFQPDWVWQKTRSSARSNYLQDAVRGAQKQLISDSTGAETSFTNGITSFDSDGFSVGNSSWANGNTETKVAWNWLAGNGTVSNTDGSITTTVSANTTAGFSVATYTGNGTGGATIGHGLSSAPKMVIVKRRDAADDWSCFHASLGGTKYIDLNSTNAAGTSIVVWNNTAPSSTVVTLGTSNRINGSGATYVAYSFAEIESYSKIGSYTGNGSTDGTFVHCGFRPAFVMVKRTDSAADWLMFDAKRDIDNEITKFLYPNLSIAEATGSGVMDFLSNGFKLRGSTANRNASGGTYIFLAFAEAPFKSANAR